jgi:hypothetical protein
MFSWSHAALFLEDVPEEVRVEVLLSGDDAIVPAALVRNYVDQHQRTRNAAGNGTGDGAITGPDNGDYNGVAGGHEGVQKTGGCVWFEKVHHGQLMLHERYVAAIAKSVRACL